MTSRRGKILVIRGGAIGDFILTLPVMAALRRQFPGADLEVLGYPHIAQLALAGGLASRVESIEARALATFFARNGELAPQVANYFSGFDLIISYLYDPDLIFQSNLGRCTRAQYIAGPHRPDEDAEVHATDVFLKPLERLAIFDADPTPRLNFETAGKKSASLEQWVAAHPGSGGENKNWPESKWAELLKSLMDDPSLKLLLIGGEAERGRIEWLANVLPSGRLTVMQSVPLPELAERLATCTLFIGHDSGISHLAAAVGLRALILWGESTEAVWRPRGHELMILRDSNGLAHLSVAVVRHHLQQLLERK